jgi:phage terminase large subunit GpA-like protein
MIASLNPETIANTDFDRMVHDWLDVMDVPPVRTPNAWAEVKRVLPPGEAEPGKYRPERTPYLKEIGEAFINPEYSRIVIAKGSQLGLSEFAINAVGQKLDDCPVPVLYVAPTQRLVESISINRVGKMIDMIPSLLAKKAGGKRDKIGEKYVSGVRLGFAWAGSATELSSHPAGLAVTDELDRMPRDVGGEGDPVEIIDTRGTTYPDFVHIVISTPTILGGSPILALLEEGTFQKWYVPCMYCNK